MAPRPSTRIPIGADPPELPKTVGVLLEIGCGNAIHLAELASAFSHLIGADISPGRVDAAWAKGANLPYRDRIDLHVDPAEEPRTIDDASVGVVLCLSERHGPRRQLHFTRTLRKLRRCRYGDADLPVCLKVEPSNIFAAQSDIKATLAADTPLPSGSPVDSTNRPHSRGDDILSSNCRARDRCLHVHCRQTW